jgi:hypothetical protein
MIDLVGEDTLRVEEAAAIVRRHFSTVYRWCLRGVPDGAGNRIKLRAVRVGGCWLTSRQALQEFAEALTPKSTDDAVIPPRTQSAKRAASAKAAAKLESLGI